MTSAKTIAIIGGGPAALFMYRCLIDAGGAGLEIAIYESKRRLGAGMPYSNDGASLEHVTNVSGNEIPDITVSVHNWIKTDPIKFLIDMASHQKVLMNLR